MSTVVTDPSVPTAAPSGAQSPQSLAIRVEGISKRYEIGKAQEKYQTLRDTIARAAASPFRRWRRRRTGSPEERTIWALRDVSFEVRRGEVLGVIGRNGAGKSTLLKILSRITDPSEGRAEIHGRVGSLLEVGTGFHNELTGRENVFLNGAILGMRRAEIQAKFDEIVAFAEIDKFIDTPVKHYSTGMYMRLAFAVAAFLEPEVLLVDEVLAVGDAMFQKKCLGKMEDVARTGRTVLFISHNMAAIRALCTSGLVLHEGRIVEHGAVGRCVETYFRQIGAFQLMPESGAESGERFGFGRVLVNGNRASSALHSEPIELETTLRLQTDANGFSLIVSLDDVFDRTILHFREESSDLGLGPVTAGDEFKVQITVPPLWLNPGLYAAEFKVLLWGGRDNARQVSDKIPIDVTGTYSRGQALLHPPARWSVVRR
jgi:lipopolysaccharide transport system ATP-binding protein